MLGASILLCWLPGLGAFAAGWLGARGRSAKQALQSAVAVGLLWSALLFLLGGREWRVGGQTVEIPALKWVGFAYLVAMTGGAFTAVLGGRLRLAGLILGLLGIGGVTPAVNELLAVGKVANTVLSEKYDEARNKTCPDHLKQLYNAMMLYSDSYDGQLPPADRWMDAIKENVPQDEWLHCTEVKKGFGYAMNSAVGGMRVSAVKNPDRTLILFESTKTERNAHDNGESLPVPGRHMGRSNVVFVNGTVKSEIAKPQR
jgi:hypothetical protein